MDSPFLSPALAAGAGGFYLTGEDNLRLTTWGALASAVVTVTGRIVSSDGRVTPFAETQVPNSDRSAKVSIFPTCEGILTNVQAFVSTGTSTIGTVAALLEVIRGREGAVLPVGTLIQGYLNSATRRGWPGSSIDALVAGAGRLRVIVGTNPAPGAEISEVVPTGARWKLRSIRWTLVAAAIVASRRSVLTIDDGANVLWETSSAVDVTTGQTATYNAAVGVPFFTYGTLLYHLPLPGELWLPAAARLRTVTANLQGTDDYGAPVYVVEEFVEQ
jgi:hypothetical protein